MTEFECVEIAEKIRAYHKKHKCSQADLTRKFSEKYGLTAARIRRIVLNECWVKPVLPEGTWKPINLLGKAYYISDCGSVWSVLSNKELDAWHPSGYKIIGVVDPDSKKLISFRVHRLVLELFDRPPKEGEVGRHFDGDSRNNHISNLFWGTHLDNKHDDIRNGIHNYGEDAGPSKLTEKQVREIVESYDKQKHGGVKSYARTIISLMDLNVSEIAIVRIFRGQTWNHVTGFKRRHISGEGKPFDEFCARTILHNWNKSSLSLSCFCDRFAAALNARGYTGVNSGAVRKMIKGKLMKKVFQEFYSEA